MHKQRWLRSGKTLKGLVGKTFAWAWMGAMVSGSFALVTPAQAVVSPGCLALGGFENGAGECELAAGAYSKQGTFLLDETLRMKNGAIITVPGLAGGNNLTISSIASIILETGSAINGPSIGSGLPAIGATVTLEADSDNDLDGDVIVQVGAQVTSNGVYAGDINITGKDVDIDGIVEAVGSASGNGQVSASGGVITIIAKCDLSVTGRVSSIGKDPGPDLVHLEGGCAVRIVGLVESTGAAHGMNTVNKCTIDHPDKDPKSIACVEIWAGNSLVIDARAGLNGEINADRTKDGDRKAWIDLFAGRGDVQIFGETSGTVFAVHANGASITNNEAGDIRIASKEGAVTVSGLAVQANALGSGSAGGTVNIEAALDVNLDTASISARGGNAGAARQGGIITSRSFQGLLSWQNGNGNVNPNNTPAGFGFIALESCVPPINTGGTNFNGAVPTTTTNSCATLMPSFPQYVVFPPCLCLEDVKCMCIDRATVNAAKTTLSLQGCAFKIEDPLNPPNLKNNLKAVGFAPACTNAPTCVQNVVNVTGETTANLAVPACAAGQSLFVILGFENSNGVGIQPNSWACSRLPLQF